MEDAQRAAAEPIASAMTAQRNAARNNQNNWKIRPKMPSLWPLFDKKKIYFTKNK